MVRRTLRIGDAIVTVTELRVTFVAHGARSAELAILTVLRAVENRTLIGATYVSATDAAGTLEGQLAVLAGRELGSAVAAVVTVLAGWTAGGRQRTGACLRVRNRVLRLTAATYRRDDAALARRTGAVSLVTVVLNIHTAVTMATPRDTLRVTKTRRTSS